MSSNVNVPRLHGQFRVLIAEMSANELCIANCLPCKQGRLPLAKYVVRNSVHVCG